MAFYSATDVVLVLLKLLFFTAPLNTFIYETVLPVLCKGFETPLISLYLLISAAIY